MQTDICSGLTEFGSMQGYIAWGQMDSRVVGGVACHFSRAEETEKS